MMSGLQILTAPFTVQGGVRWGDISSVVILTPLTRVRPGVAHIGV